MSPPRKREEPSCSNQEGDLSPPRGRGRKTLALQTPTSITRQSSDRQGQCPYIKNDGKESQSDLLTGHTKLHNKSKRKVSPRPDDSRGHHSSQYTSARSPVRGRKGRNRPMEDGTSGSVVSDPPIPGPGGDLLTTEDKKFMEWGRG